MGNVHHPGAGGLTLTLHQPVWFSFSQSKSNSFAFSNYVSPPRPVSALKSGCYFTQKPTGQQIAAHTVTQLNVTTGKARLSTTTAHAPHINPGTVVRQTGSFAVCLSTPTNSTNSGKRSAHRRH